MSMVGRWDTPDTPGYRRFRAGQLKPCEVLVAGVWCEGELEVWQWRDHNPDCDPDLGLRGWWGYGSWYLPTGPRAGGWKHQSQLRPVISPGSPPRSP